MWRSFAQARSGNRFARSLAALQVCDDETDERLAIGFILELPGERRGRVRSQDGVRPVGSLRPDVASGGLRVAQGELKRLL